MDKKLLFSIDNQIIDKERISVLGWAILKGENLDNENVVNYTVLNSKGEPVELKINIHQRIDASLSILGNDSQSNCGFRISFEYSAKEKYQLCILGGGERQCISIRPKNLLSQRQRKYHPITYVIRNFSLSNIKKDFRIFLRGGIKPLKREWFKRYAMPTYQYEAWYKKHKVTEKELIQQRQKIFDFSPLISIIVPAYETPESFLRELIDSVQAQSYANWELCFADGSNGERVGEIIKEYQIKDKRIVYQKLAENYGICGNSNAALKMASGNYFALLDHDDLLTPDALYEVVKAMNDAHADVIYTDEDKISMDGQHQFDPYFKPDLNISLLRSNNYICHFFVAKREYVLPEGFRDEYNGSQDYDLILRCVEQAKIVYHIPKILYHWRTHQNSTAADPKNKMYCYEAGKRAIESHLKRLQITGNVNMTDLLGFYRVQYPVDKNSLLSIVVFGKDHLSANKTIDNLKCALKEIKFEIIDEAGRKDEVSAVSEACQKAKGDYLLFLRNGMMFSENTDDSLKFWLGEIQCKDVAAVGIKVCTEHRTIVQCGQKLNKQGKVVSFFAGFPQGEIGYFNRARLQQEISLVSFDAVMISKNWLKKTDGWNAKFGKYAADADLCLQLNQAGGKIVLDPGITMIFTGQAGDAITQAEQDDLAAKWSVYAKEHDPGSNPNMDDEAVDYSIGD